MPRTTPSLTGLLLTLAAAAALGACTSRQLYAAGQQWQANECRKLPQPEQPRCRASNALSFEDYQREAAAARAAQ
ncbi:MAG: hypothetical protein H6932_16430 [Burkholderiaceae bacterium]|uniref:Lipoprotein n=1 Tax=Rubrivivax albus TaxID=2499835 RepID=A0A437JSK2_9BURK|nr:hypothetical protein [Rubrivivax albus]MCB1997069.1 hypothetical protein [Rhodoferax sp.]MCP5272786.1 hypothetical protein [Burkholderiaceae bacterium]RVT50008.1 hypothetical protein ENE75_16930 [Rubrivivax albus]